MLFIDVEPDDFTFPPDRPSAWTGFEYLTSHMDKVRGRLQEATGSSANFSWSLRMDPQIEVGYGSPAYVVDCYAGALSRLIEAGDVLGIHPHAWRWDAQQEAWISDHANQTWIDECVRMSFETFQSVFATPPTYHRFGDRFMNSALMNLVRELGIPADHTLEPGVQPVVEGQLHGGYYTGSTGDFVHVPRFAYRPDDLDFRRVGPVSDDRNFWAVPLTSGNLPMQTHHIQRSWDRASHPRSSARRLISKARHRLPVAMEQQIRPLAMWEEWKNPKAFWDAAFTAAAQLAVPYLAFAIRSDTGSNPKYLHKFEALIERLIVDRRASRLSFVSATDCFWSRPVRRERPT